MQNIRYEIVVKFNGEWGLYQTAETKRAAVNIASRLSWPTEIRKAGAK